MAIVLHGTWWVADHRPEQDHRSLAGTLTIDENGRGFLELPPTPPPLLADQVNGVWRTTAAGNAALAVHGQTAHGLRITLLHATGAPSLRAAVVIVGAWLHPGRPADLDADTPVPRERRADLVPGEDVAAFTGIEVELQHLGDWSAARTVRRHQPHDLDDDTLLVERRPSLDHIVTLDDGVTVALVSDVRMNSERTSEQSTITITETIRARVSTPEPVSLNTLRRHVRSLRRLVGLAVSREAGVLAATVHPAPDNDSGGTLSSQDDEHLRTVTLHGAFPPADRHDTTPLGRVLFTLDDVRLDVVLPRWQRNAERLDGVLASLAIARDRNALLEPRLMAAATAAETLHRAHHGTLSEPAMPDADYVLLRQHIVAGVTAAIAAHPHLAEHENAVLGRFHNQGRTTLHTRLLGLADMLGPHAAPLLTGDHLSPSPEPQPPPSLSREAQAWARATTRARNNIAHDGLVGAIGHTAAVTVLWVTTAVVELLVLRELGIDERHLDVLVHHQRFRLAHTLRRDLLPLLDAENAAPQPDPSPLMAALIQAAAAAWSKTGWVDWKAIAGAAQRHEALPTGAAYEDVVNALTAELGTHAPPPKSGPGGRLGWSATDLFIAINDHHTATAPFPAGWWRRHRHLAPALQVLPTLAGVEPERVPVLLDEHQLTAVDRDRLTELTIQAPHRISAWFPAARPVSA
ncbi:hypothetical protein G7043_41315 [Lentzea sp. NEAU-D13]|uniref:ApeA N-terminal domain-containing protein n=1 Tax=Lentzea alba TaxID=2714351 RepID=A0A7C9VVY6_9PSEU|nr:HEPN domain-containing protein [Lentzea alba]NGY65353.1 hypothetical protein [Lentzea alba]